ncbi:oligosaccharide flippase family protein [Actinomycetospora callitridis]|uniref:oligosaccharide flippase family protein n=1 Tax=Actinomycetospora callitridis TaxID=913944 RepID=UPI0023670D93|nr:oligosaccharide flippase family protein [Actinomycetospora callitridis]MDD7917649.1 oligosaccharide flippase family protein [Actinomycetospora callitridis]
MILRMMIGMAISGVGLLAITRILGPSVYGVYGTAFATWFLVQNLAELNLDVWLVRRPTGQDIEASGTAQTILLCTSAVGALALYLAAPLASSITSLPEVEGALRMMCPALLLAGLGQVPLSVLERGFNFRAVGVVELIGQAAFNVAAVLLALNDWGLVSLTIALNIQQFVLLVGFVSAYGGIPRLSFDRTLASNAIRFGLAATGSSIVENGRVLVIQLVVARFGGATGAGVYSLCMRIIEQTAFLRQIIYRLATPIFGRLRDERSRLQRTVADSLHVQAMAAGLPPMVICWVAPILVPVVFGPEWSAAADLLPLLLPTFLLLCTFQLYQHGLLALDRSFTVLISNLGYLIALTISLWFLVAAFGTPGVAISEAIASLALPGLALALRSTLLLRPAASLIAIVVGITVAGLAAITTWWAVLALLPPLAFPKNRRLILDSTSSLISVR